MSTDVGVTEVNGEDACDDGREDEIPAAISSSDEIVSVLCSSFNSPLVMALSS